MDENKKIYIIGLLASISIVPMFFAKLLAELIEGVPSDTQLLISMILIKSGLIIITFWYSLMVGMKIVDAGILGLIVALPFVWWISVIYLLTKKQPHYRTPFQNTIFKIRSRLVFWRERWSNWKLTIPGHMENERWIVDLNYLLFGGVRYTIPGHMENERWIPEHDTELGMVIEFLRGIIVILVFLLIAAAAVIGLIFIIPVVQFLIGFILLCLIIIVEIIFEIIDLILPFIEWATPIIMDFLKKLGL